MLGILQQNKELSSHNFIKDPNSESKNWKKLKNVRIQRFFLNLTYINFRQTNAINMNFFTQALCWEYYSKPKNVVVIQFIKYPNFDLKN